MDPLDDAPLEKATGDMSLISIWERGLDIGGEGTTPTDEENTGGVELKISSEVGNVGEEVASGRYILGNSSASLGERWDDKAKGAGVLWLGEG